MYLNIFNLVLVVVCQYYITSYVYCNLEPQTGGPTVVYEDVNKDDEKQQDIIYMDVDLKHSIGNVKMETNPAYGAVYSN